MTIKNVFIIVLSTVLMVPFICGCSKTPKNNYNISTTCSNEISDYIMDGCQLTIYYTDPTILTRAPLNVEDLISFPETEKIVVTYEKMVANIDLFKKINFSDFKYAKEEFPINARMYYVLETVNSEKLLEVIISQVHDSVVVNGMQVDDYSLFYELVAPFLTEEARKMYG